VIQLSTDKNIEQIDQRNYGLSIRPRRVLLTCGEGYQHLQKPLALDDIDMQIRPLHMAMVAHNSNNLPLFAHAVCTSSTPLLTVTTHRTRQNRSVWYLGGSIAEAGVTQTKEDLIANAQASIRKLLPWVELKNAVWDTVAINRAEPLTPNRLRPDAAYLSTQGNCLVAWPSKLALSPQLSDQVLNNLAADIPHQDDLSALLVLPAPEIAPTPWETL